MNDFTIEIIKILKNSNWKEPTKEEYPTYIKASNMKNNTLKFYEDMHYVWRNYKPKTK